MIVTKTLMRMVEFFGADVRRINHALKVHSFARLIANQENITGTELNIIELSAILHDIGIPAAVQKYQSSAGKYQEIEGPPIAREMLMHLGASPETIYRICYLIGNHHSYTKIDGIDFQILVEADFLVNIFEDKMNAATVSVIRQKYFKTRTGVRLLEQIYMPEK
ncbi:HD domain-containing protein [Gaoshiqia sediminis]|uniref:HD domain-containing protein n=1 Tax=Gaoshiqia sediminis TaxID=2986998 RepID=A0AA42CB39_9BACT|nr:HD domain-containing protein [Gaoshiqia sediminis]MCW0484712.1 HD domain-containing protein [Gaoshiqia sediminis]